MNQRTQEIYDDMSQYDIIQFKKQQSEIMMIDKLRNQMPQMTDAERRKKIGNMQPKENWRT